MGDRELKTTRHTALLAVTALADAVSADTTIRPGHHLGGNAGAAIMLQRAGFFLNREDLRDSARTLEKHLMTVLSNFPLTPWLYEGVAGVAYVLEALAVTWVANGQSAIDEDALDEVDQFLFEAVAAELKREQARYELIRGMSGIGVYALIRRRRATGDALLSAVIDALDEVAEKENGLTTWRTPREDMRGSASPYNLGLSHGVPGAAAICACAFQRGVNVAKAHALALESSAWLLKQQQQGQESRFPYTVGKAETSRLAWCYGDLSVGVGLTIVARALADAKLEAFCGELFAMAGRRDVETSGVIDLGLCHGLTGIAHVLSRASESLSTNNLAAVARQWIDRADFKLLLNDGAAAIQSFTVMDAKWIDDYGFLTGASGVVHYLLDRLEAPDMCGWDAPLMTCFMGATWPTSLASCAK